MAQQEVVPTGPTKCTTAGKMKGICLVGIEKYFANEVFTSVNADELLTPQWLERC